MHFSIHHWNNSGISNYIFGCEPAQNLLKEEKEEGGFCMTNKYGNVAVILSHAEPIFNGYRVVQILFSSNLADFMEEEGDFTTRKCQEFAIGSYTMKKINDSSGSDMSTDSEGESIESLEENDKDSLLFNPDHKDKEVRQQVDEQREFVNLSYQLNDKLVGDDSNLEALRLWINSEVNNDIWLNCSKHPGYTVVRLLEYLKKFKPGSLHRFYSIIKEKMQFPEIAGMIEKSPCFNLFNKS